MLNNMEKAALDIEIRGKNVVVRSMDVVGLRPNLDMRRSAAEVGKAATETDIEIVDANWEWCQKYVAMNLSQEEIEREGLGAAVPRRKHRQGNRPGISVS